MSISALPPNITAQAAKAVYKAKDIISTASSLGKTDLAQLFNFGDSPSAGPGAALRITARSGAFEFKSKTGFAVMAMGRKGGNYEDQAVLLCRGTVSAYDWLTDANYALGLGPSGSLVHSGFNRTFGDLKTGITQFLSQNSPRHIHCIGHSLGGALATLAADWLSNKGLGVDLYTFGSPRVGTETFANDLTRKAKPKNIFRVCHSSDPVTMVPVWPYLHAPRPDGECWVSKSAGVNIMTHRMEVYMETVKQKSWQDLYRPTPSMWVEYSHRVWTTESLASLLTTVPMLALNAILRTLCKGVAITILPGMSLLDQLSMWVEKAAGLSIESESNVRTFLQAIVKALGLAIVIPEKILHSTIRALLEAVTRASYNQAIRASALVLSGVLY